MNMRRPGQPDHELRWLLTEYVRTRSPRSDARRRLLALARRQPVRRLPRVEWRWRRALNAWHHYLEGQRKLLTPQVLAGLGLFEARTTQVRMVC